MIKGGCVYIMTNKHHTTLYVGVTSDLYSRITEHIEKKYPSSFTARYNINILIYFESFNSIDEAIVREKQLKAGSRAAKIKLIESVNPQWRNLIEDIEKW